MAYKLIKPLYAGVNVPASTVTGDATDGWEFDGASVVAILACTLKSGSGALDVKFQTLVPGTSTWVDIGVAFTQKTGTGTEAKVVTLPGVCRVSATVASTAVYDINVWLSGRGGN